MHPNQQRPVCPSWPAPQLRSFLRVTCPAVLILLVLGRLFAASLPASSNRVAKLVAAYHFDEGVGATLTDVSGRNHHGTLINGPAWTRQGKYGGALQFDGTDDLVSIRHTASLDLRAGLTIEAWIDPRSGGIAGPIVVKGTPGSASSFLSRRHDPRHRADLSYALFTAPLLRRAGFVIGVDRKDYVISDARSFSTGWTHVAGTYDGSAARLYVNGSLVRSHAARGDVTASSGPLQIGAGGIWGHYFHGKIDEVRLYDRALTQTQIRSDMLTPVGPPVAADTFPPAVSLTAPASGTTVSETVDITAQASDNVGVVSVQFLRDGADLGAPDTSAPYAVRWDSRTAANGNHTFAARAVDAAGNSRTAAAVTVAVYNAPRLVITQPVDGSTVTGPAVPVTYTAVGDSTGVAHVHFLLDGGPDSIDTTVDGSYTFTSLPAGAHELRGYLARHDHSRIPGSDAAPIGFNTTNPPGSIVLGTLNGHTVYGDASNQLVSWLTPQDSAYDQAIATAWDFLLNRVPDDMNGIKAYFTNPSLYSGTLAPSGWLHNPAHLYASVIESALAYYAYSGDARVVTLARSMADYHLAHGLTPADWSWARVPYASGCGNCTEYDATGTFDSAGHVEPDKIGEFGLGLIRLYEFTGDVRYRDTAIASADTLASHVRTGNATQSPWPFRVDAQSGIPREDYTANVIKPVGLFDELIRLNLGHVASYRAARTIALDWLFAYPMRNNVWANYFEDLDVQPNLDNHNQYVPMETAYYLMRHPEHDPDWRTHVPALLAWVESVFGEPQFGATAISEQILFRYVMGSHTARYGAVNALYSALTGDPAARDKAYRALNWATYMISTTPQGQIIDGPDVNLVWFTDGYADYIRHFMRGVGAVPEWAPDNQNHLTRSTSVVTAITYTASEITYTTADPDATDTLKVSFTPVEVAADGLLLPRSTDLRAPGWVYDAATRVLTVRHSQATAMRISDRASGADTVAPVIGSVAASGMTDATATIAWVTDEPADSQVEYGTSTAYGNLTPLSPFRATSHALVVPGLSPVTVYHYRVISSDAAGNRAVSGDSTFTTTVVDTTPPAIAIVAPVEGSTVSGSAVTIEADASDDVRVASVQFLLDEASVGGQQTVAPYSIRWDSTAVANGTHRLSARAIDAAGHSTTSAVVNVTVTNPPQIVTFNQLSLTGAPLNGQHPTGVVDWGSNMWLLSGPWGPFTTNSISFSASASSASLRFVVPRRLIGLTAFNGGSESTTVTLSCSGNPVTTASVEPNQVLTIDTNWSGNCYTVTIGSSNGWDTNFDDLTFDVAR